MEKVHWEDTTWEADYWLAEEPERGMITVLIPGTLKAKRETEDRKPES
jgi:hypothetical protein